MARSSVIHESIYEAIIKKVLSGKIASGTRLVERDLAESHYLPVRAARRQLPIPYRTQFP